MHGTPEPDPKVVEGSDDSGSTLVLDVVAGLPSNGFVNQKHEGLVPEEEKVVLHDLVELRGQVALDKRPVHLRSVLAALRAVSGDLGSSKADVARKQSCL